MSFKQQSEELARIKDISKQLEKYEEVRDHAINLAIERSKDKVNYTGRQYYRTLDFWRGFGWAFLVLLAVCGIIRIFQWLF